MRPVSRALLPLALAASLFAAHLCRAQGADPFTAQQAISSSAGHADGSASERDSDQDGLNDALEQALLVHFAPRFFIGEHDCSVAPAEFTPNKAAPQPRADNGTLYGQVFPVKSSAPGLTAEIHYFHLWRKDCGGHGHPLDTEHVATLVHTASATPTTADWKALFWYAAAHEDTVCDVSQIARASTLRAETHGAAVWISPGKHASYLDAPLCAHGCGADRCLRMVPFTPSQLINLGEPSHPMNGSTFIASGVWGLQGKMAASNFPPATLARVDQLPAAEIALFHPGKHPAQGVIAISSSTEQSLAQSEQNTAGALSTAGSATGGALAVSGNNTGNALQKSLRKTRHALATSARHVGSALDPGSSPAAPH